MEKRKIPMHGKKLSRRMLCSVNKCGSRDTYMFHRGEDVNYHPLHLCGSCIRDIVSQYIVVAGKEKARETLWETVKQIMPAAETEAEYQPDTGRRRRGE